MAVLRRSCACKCTCITGFGRSGLARFREGDSALMMREKDFVLPLPRPKNDASNAHSSGRLDRKTVEALREFLHEMTATIQSLTIRHNLVYQGYNSHVLQAAEMRNSFSKGVSLMSNDIPAVAIDVSPAQSDYRDGVQVVSQSLHRNGSHVPRPHYQTATLVRSQELTIRQSDRAQSSAKVSRGTTCIGALLSENGAHKVQEAKTRNMVTGIINVEGRTRKGPSEPNCNKHALDAKTADALRCFLEEMKKTIQLWSIRHRLLDQVQAELARENEEMPEPMHFELASPYCIQPSRVGDVYSPLQNQEVEAARDSNQPANGQACALASNQLEIQDSSKRPAGVQTLDCEIREPNSEGISEYSLDSNHAKGKDLRFVKQCPPDGQLQQVIFHDRVVDCSLVPCERGEILNNCAPANTSEIMRQSLTSADVVKVVESPDWLPYGWTTEVKIRQRGNSAGTTDKYYYDPISKRRFRSRKEVFCFLTTGKAGRYKSKSKVKIDKGASNRDCNPLPPPPTSTYQFLTGKISPLQAGMPVLFFPHMPSSPYGTLPCASASGFFSNLFLPCLPSPHSDGLMHETFFNVPHPVQLSPPLSNNGVNNADEGRPQHSLQGSHMSEIGRNSFYADIGDTNSAGLHDRSRGLFFGETTQPQDCELGSSDGTSNFRAQQAVGKLPQSFKKIESRSLDKNVRSPKRSRHGFGLNLLAKNIKKTKPQEKQDLEALGRVICQQGLSFLQGGKKLNVHCGQTALKSVAG